VERDRTKISKGRKRKREALDRKVWRSGLGSGRLCHRRSCLQNSCGRNTCWQ
jgi:hypothetical protein